MDRIESSQNTRYKGLHKLITSKAARNQANLIVLDGMHLVQDYVTAYPQSDIQIFIDETNQRDEIAALIHTLDASYSITELSAQLFQKIRVTKTPQGIIAIAPRPKAVVNQHAAGSAVGLEGLQDPGNLGAILRSASAFGIKRVYLTRDCVDPFSPKSLRGGMGAQFRLEIIENADLSIVIQEFKGRSIATIVKGGEPLNKVNLAGDVIFLIGSEGAGLSDDVKESVDQLVSIPLVGGVESLNAASAASLFFYQKQIFNKKSGE